MEAVSGWKRGWGRLRVGKGGGEIIGFYPPANRRRKRCMVLTKAFSFCLFWWEEDRSLLLFLACLSSRSSKRHYWSFLVSPPSKAAQKSADIDDDICPALESELFVPMSAAFHVHWVWGNKTGPEHDDARSNLSGNVMWRSYPILAKNRALLSRLHEERSRVSSTLSGIKKDWIESTEINLRMNLLENDNALELGPQKILLGLLPSYPELK